MVEGAIQCRIVTFDGCKESAVAEMKQSVSKWMLWLMGELNAITKEDLARSEPKADAEIPGDVVLGVAGDELKRLIVLCEKILRQCAHAVEAAQKEQHARTDPSFSGLSGTEIEARDLSEKYTALFQILKTCLRMEFVYSRGGVFTYVLTKGWKVVAVPLLQRSMGTDEANGSSPSPEIPRKHTLH